MNPEQIKLEPSWKKVLISEFEKDYMVKLKNFLGQEIQKKKIIYPHGKNIFNAFNFTPFDQTKVVIIGQDPYHGPNQAHGLCFSVRPPVPPPPSLVNIFKEMEADLNITRPDHGCLTSWAKQGVLLLNNVLTVENGKAASHNGKGWEQLTDYVVDRLNSEREGLVFLLWGSFAQKKCQFVNPKKHYILRSPHPSPLSAHRGFFGSKPFSRINTILKKLGKAPINWELPSLDKIKLN